MEQSRAAGAAFSGIQYGYLQSSAEALVARTRPYDLLGYEILVRRLGDYSFPSGHTSASFAAATAIYAIDRRWGAAAYVLAALIGFSRLYLGVHFPTDVLAGAVVGILAAKAAQCLLEKKMHFNK